MEQQNIIELLDFEERAKSVNSLNGEMSENERVVLIELKEKPALFS